jgi:hypothetical protein
MRDADAHPARLPLHIKILTGVIWMAGVSFLVWCLASMVSCAIDTARAGVCHYFADGENSVTACEAGSHVVRRSASEQITPWQIRL